MRPQDRLERTLPSKSLTEDPKGPDMLANAPRRHRQDYRKDAEMHREARRDAPESSRDSSGPEWRQTLRYGQHNHTQAKRGPEMDAERQVPRGAHTTRRP